MPESHSEVYGEYGFDDNRFDLEDLWVSPEHSRAYMFGFHKIHSIKTKKEYVEFTAEITHIESGKELMNRIQFGYAVFYDGDYSNFVELAIANWDNGSPIDSLTLFSTKIRYEKDCQTVTGKLKICNG